MQFSGKLLNVSRDWSTGQFQVTFSVNESGVINEVESIKDCNLDIKAVKHRKKRSLNANAMLWACIGDIAAALHADKWDIYLKMLKRYGKYSYIIAKPEAVEGIKMMWRECQDIGEIDVNGKKGVQLLCYFGSSTLNTKEFSVLLEGVVSEMKEMGLDTPPSQDMRRALEQWEKMHNE